jgi:DNA-binding Lrp family transcriptional regulator
MSRKKQIDEIDLKILNILQSEGSISNRDLARRVDLSPPPTLKRVMELVNNGFIKSFAGIVDYHKFGYKYMTAVEYTVLKPFAENFIDVIMTSKYIILLFEISRDLGIDSKYCNFLTIYIHKNKEHLIARMKEVLGPIPYNVEFRVYEVVKVLKELPTIKLSLDDVVN